MPDRNHFAFEAPVGGTGDMEVSPDLERLRVYTQA